MVGNILNVEHGILDALGYTTTTFAGHTTRRSRRGSRVEQITHIAASTGADEIGVVGRRTEM